MALLVIKALFRIVAEKVPTMKSLDSDKKASKTSEAAPAASEPTTSVSAESVQLDLSKVKIEPLFEEFVDFDTFAKSEDRKSTRLNSSH